MKNLILVVCTIFYLLSFCFAAVSEEALPGLSLEECLNIALNNHPSLKKSKGSVRAATSAIEQAKTSNRVKINLSGSENYNGDYDDSENNYYTHRVGINVTKTLYDTGVNKLNIEFQKLNLDSVLDSERQTQITVAANAKRAYYDLVLKILNRNVEHEKLSNLEEHLQHARGIYEVGNSPYIDVTKAEADLASARVSSLKAENDILVSKEALKVAMGMNEYDSFNLVLTTKLLMPPSAGDIDQLLNIAMEDRADYQKMLHTMKQHDLSVKIAARDNTPTITGTLATNLTKREDFSTATDYSAAINLNIPITDGGLMKSKVESARAQLDQDRADEESLRQTITHDVRSAALTLSNAIDRVKSSELSVKYAEENLALAQGRYEVGVGAALEVSDAVSTLSSSRYAFYQALYDAQVARTNLDEAMGHFPIELTGENERSN